MKKNETHTNSDSKYKVVVVIPTYNECENIEHILKVILIQAYNNSKFDLQILVVDDKSPDGTADIVKEYVRASNRVHLITGEKQGLGVAYQRGFNHAINVLDADIVFEIDADMSHDPKLIPNFIREIELGADFVIGSRYIPGGTIPADWSRFRILNSKVANWIARYIGGMSNIADCTSGYRAIHTRILKSIDYKKLRLKGYGFQINLLNEALIQGAKVKEIPIHFKDREHGVSKIKVLQDGLVFVGYCFGIRSKEWKNYNVYNVQRTSLIALFPITIINTLVYLGLYESLIITLVTISLIMVAQGLFSLYCALYTWDKPEKVVGNKSPERYTTPKYTFTALLPARNEEEVIGYTIQAVSEIDYPEDLTEIIVLCRQDDTGTIAAANNAIKRLGKTNIRIIADTNPRSKPAKLNIGAKAATKNIVCVFDAEDTPHKDIYNIVNTVLIERKADVVQCGVQLMNFDSKWFSALNVLEYYFWFKSALQFFAKVGLITLGGNTVFFKKSWLKRIGGWDETCLTEDADVGIKLSIAGARIEVLYDQEHATQEETPHDIENFIKQRTRWCQGFIQVLLKGEWKNLKKTSQKFLAIYLLGWPLLNAIMFMYIPISLALMFFVKLPVWATMITILPIYVLIFQLIVILVGFRQFIIDYKLKSSWYFPLYILLWFFPYQLLLGLGSYRAVFRLMSGQMSWEKTAHVNAHRNTIVLYNNDQTI